METITVEIIIDSSVQRVWEMFTNPEYIMKWNHATDDWECTYAKNELHVGGSFVFRTTAKDKSASFNLMGKYKNIEKLKSISYVLNDKRKATVTFEKIKEGQTKVTKVLQLEIVRPKNDQQLEQQSILRNFKTYVEDNPALAVSEIKEVAEFKDTDTWVG